MSILLRRTPSYLVRNCGALQGAVRHRGAPAGHYPPPPPPEFMPDGSPKRYPLVQPLYNHGYTWEHWSLMPAGVYHTVYHGDFAIDSTKPWAWISSYPGWAGWPLLLFFIMNLCVLTQNAGSIGIKPIRYTPEWIIANKERERIENCNPISRYLDRRRAERGQHWVLANYMPNEIYSLWMRNSHDWDEMERRAQIDIEQGIDAPGASWHDRDLEGEGNQKYYTGWRG